MGIWVQRVVNVLEEIQRKLTVSQEVWQQGSPANVVIRLGKVPVPHFNMEHGAVMVVHVQSETFKESRVEGLGLHWTLKPLRTKLELTVWITESYMGSVYMQECVYVCVCEHEHRIDTMTSDMCVNGFILGTDHLPPNWGKSWETLRKYSCDSCKHT